MRNHPALEVRLIPPWRWWLTTFGIYGLGALLGMSVMLCGGLGFALGERHALSKFGDAIPLQSADGGCVAVSPSRHEVVGSWARTDGQCNLAEWRSK